LAEAGLDALALNAGPSLVYLTGMHFHLMERPVIGLFTPDKTPVLVMAQLEIGKTHNLGYDLEVCTYGEDPSMWSRAFAEGVQKAGLSGGEIGIEYNQCRVLEESMLQTVLPEATFANAEDTVAALRMYKDAAELAAMRKAAEIAEAALEATKPLIKVGVTERQIASELVGQLLRHGSDPDLPFFPIVSGGPENSANPHAVPTDRALQAGDLLVIDYGANYEGYLSDITRTFAIGEISAELQKIYETVKQANAAGRAKVAPGVAAGEVDAAARAVIDAAGYGEYFFHRTGHGLGMEGHEPPYIRGDNQRVLQPGMTFTVEPGIYITGLGGVRIEDDVAVAADGCDTLTTLPRELETLG
ncbi:MAG: aminopeptidase P family protein, partial [Anaerolineales bacterium]|nr:aminopeptidase P family protein [Anaerolineales bacterium]